MNKFLCFQLDLLDFRFRFTSHINRHSRDCKHAGCIQIALTLPFSLRFRAPCVCISFVMFMHCVLWLLQFFYFIFGGRQKVSRSKKKTFRLQRTVMREDVREEHAGASKREHSCSVSAMFHETLILIEFIFGATFKSLDCQECWSVVVTRFGWIYRILNEFWWMFWPWRVQAARDVRWFMCNPER